MITFQGLASGLDTSSIIESLLSVYQRRIELLRQRQEQVQTRQAAFDTIEANLLRLRSYATQLSRTVGSVFDLRTVASSNEHLVQAAANRLAQSGTYTITVNQLARAHQIATQGFADQNAPISQGTLQIRVGYGPTATITIDSSNATLQALADAINSAAIGVTATIINDGSGPDSYPYRLLLRADSTGADNQIVITNNLGPDSGDAVKPVFAGTYVGQAVRSRSFSGSSVPASNAGADSYSGTDNDTYTFTVVSGGTVGADDGIQIQFSDGSGDNTGVIILGATDVDVFKDVAEGLRVKFSAGTLVAGDSFTVDVHVTTLQEAQNASITIGSGPAALSIENSSNHIEEVIPGLTLELRGADSNQAVNISVNYDTESISEAILQFVEAYNMVMESIDEQIRYDREAAVAGPLLGNIQVISIQEQLRRAVIDVVDGLPSTINRLSALGITSTRQGRLEVNKAQLQRALTDRVESVSIEDIRRLFVLDGTSTNPGIRFVSGSASTIASTTPYQVDLTQAAEQASITATYALGSPGIGSVSLGSGWSGTSQPESNSGPNYTGPDDDTYTFTITLGGTVGSSAILISYTDGSGDNSGTITLDPGYDGSYVAVAEGLQIRFPSGTLVQNETFTVNVRAQRTSTTIDASNNTLVLRIDGRQSGTIRLPEGTYAREQLASLLQSQINADAQLAGRQADVSLVDGKLAISSATYGHDSEVAIVSGLALEVLGFTGLESDRGQDVVGWFIVNGEREQAVGHGQLLVGSAGNEHTADLQVRVTLASNQIENGPEGELTITRGLASKLDQTLAAILDPVSGRLKRVEDTFRDQLEQIEERVEREKELMEARQGSLVRQFSALEQLVAQLQGYSELLTNQLMLATQWRNRA